MILHKIRQEGMCVMKETTRERRMIYVRVKVSEEKGVIYYLSKEDTYLTQEDHEIRLFDTSNLSDLQVMVADICMICSDDDNVQISLHDWYVERLSSDDGNSSLAK